jgi:hypothetical protein
MKANELKALEKRIEMLEAVEAIKHLKAKYAAVCDDKYNPPVAVKLFTEDAVWDGGKDFGIHRGRPAINSKDGKTATGKWYLWQACTLKGMGAAWIAGLEFDKYRKVNGQWLMSEMKLKLFIMAPYAEGWGKVRIVK